MWTYRGTDEKTDSVCYLESELISIVYSAGTGYPVERHVHGSTRMGICALIMLATTNTKAFC